MLGNALGLWVGNMKHFADPDVPYLVDPFPSCLISSSCLDSTSTLLCKVVAPAILVETASGDAGDELEGKNYPYGTYLPGASPTSFLATRLGSISSSLAAWIFNSMGWNTLHLIYRLSCLQEVSP
jgi:hypothetical protein